MIKNNVILASASPRRRELLGLIFKNFEILPSNVEEKVPDTVSAEETPEYLAEIKALDISKKYPDSLVIGADTIVLADGKILGKPKTKDDAEKMLRMLSGKEHKVITGCAVVKEGVCSTFSEETIVEFFDLSDKEIGDYISSDEPYDKAGGYGIQGNGSLLVKGIKGDYFNVVGLPVAKLNRFLNDLQKGVFYDLD